MGANKSYKELFIGMLKSKMFIFVVIAYMVTLAISAETFKEASMQSLDQIIEVLFIIPVIFVLIGLIDVWVDRETMIKIMGQDSGLKGIVIAFIFGTLAAGPLVGAFPLAFIMLKKGARYANVLFFLTIWSSAKLPILMFQAQAMGLTFTIVSNITLISVFLVGSLIVEKLLGQTEINQMIERAKNSNL